MVATTRSSPRSPAGCVWNGGGGGGPDVPDGRWWNRAGSWTFG